MAWFMDTYSQQVGHPARDRHRQARRARRDDRPPRGDGPRRRLLHRASVRAHRLERRRAARRDPGLGNVGAVTARELRRAARRSSRLSDATGGSSTSERPRHRGGPALDREATLLRAIRSGTPVGRQEVLEVPCDILDPGRARAPDHRGRTPTACTASSSSRPPTARRRPRPRHPARARHPRRARRAGQRRRRDRHLLRVGPGPAAVLVGRDSKPRSGCAAKCAPASAASSSRRAGSHATGAPPPCRSRSSASPRRRACAAIYP